MVQRAQVVGDPPNPAQIAAEPLARLSALEQRATSTTNADEFDDIDGEAEEWGTFRAYICPLPEIEHEGNISVNLMEEWAVPKSRVDG